MPHHHPHPFIIQTIAFYGYSLFTFGTLLAIGVGDALSRRRRMWSRKEGAASRQAEVRKFLDALAADQRAPRAPGASA